MVKRLTWFCQQNVRYLFEFLYLINTHKNQDKIKIIERICTNCIISIPTSIFILPKYMFKFYSHLFYFLACKLSLLCQYAKIWWGKDKAFGLSVNKFWAIEAHVKFRLKKTSKLVFECKVQLLYIYQLLDWYF